MKITRALAGSIATGVLAVATTCVAAPSAQAQSFSLVALEQAKTKLDASLTVPGTAFAVDRHTGRVNVQVDATVTGSKLTKVRQQVAALGGAATISSIPGKLTTKISGGDPIYGGGYVCSLGFNVTSGGTNYFLTAGHCAAVADTWYTDSGQSNVLGSGVSGSFPGNDYALVQYTGSASPSPSVDLYDGSTQTITGAATASVGETVHRSGRTTQLHSGTVTALDATVNYAEGRVDGLIQTTVCAEGGDSGGPLFDGSTALGLTSGGNGDCTSGGTTYFQPVTEALSAYGVSLL